MNRVANFRLQRAFESEVNRPSQSRTHLLSEGPDRCVVHGGRLADQNVYITVMVCLTPGNRPEQPGVRHAIPVENRQKSCCVCPQGVLGRSVLHRSSPSISSAMARPSINDLIARVDPIVQIGAGAGKKARGHLWCPRRTRQILLGACRYPAYRMDHDLVAMERY